MSTGLIWSDILAYALEIGVLVCLGALVPLILRRNHAWSQMPRVRLLYWQVLLFACLALPCVRGWRREVVTGTIQVSNVITAAATVAAPVRRVIPFPKIALWLLAAGAGLRLGFLAIGLAQLGAYRRRGCELTAIPRISPLLPKAELLLSDDVVGPVTFGWRNPVVLLPAEFPALAGEMQEAIVCHELLHVARCDWLFTIAEELVRTVLWFHPAIWWVIGEIQLAREQAVDESVVELTRAREPYVDALLLMAGALTGGIDLAPAPMFLRRRHLKRRLVEVVKEVRMKTISKTRVACLMSAALVMLVAASWFATGTFPLAAAPQAMDDAAGVAVNVNGSPLLHRSPVVYPADALAKGVEGTVVVQLRLDAAGEVSDAAVLSGPDELRKSVLQSVLTWHFDKSAALSTRTVNIDFVKPGKAVPTSAPMPRPAIATSSAATAPPPPAPPPPPASGKLDRIVVTGLSDSARDQLLSALPIKEGGEWTGQMFASSKEAVRNFDPHLTTWLAMTSAGTLELHVGLPTGLAAALIPNSAPLPANGVFSVGNGTSPPAVLSKVDPITPYGTATGFSGSVILSIVVGTDGKAEDIKVVKSIDSNFDANAVAAVQQWVFRPGMNKGEVVRVRAQIEVNFRES